MRTTRTHLKPHSKTDFSIEIPNSTDGSDVNDLIARCDPLDENSVYCNLLQCTHFSKTSAIAKKDGEVFGFVSGYKLPEDPSRLFVWQVAVDKAARGHGLAKKMILDILARPDCEQVEELHTTVTPSNSASQALFSSVAEALNTEAQSFMIFDRKQHLKDEHESEHLWVIGPFDNKAEEILKAAA
ncbi:diaminobutyrate acetyltransferase [Sneathiella glossodoripedis]|uniref:diaminobutyrate acetyltransferase n=1 Tax=Sneathiella glossodoripedis TaxID=418853 RepID=UPI00046F31A4|nr:diaminobutyrate acetyltransferase [Sneathiella glossodoripedis]